MSFKCEKKYYAEMSKHLRKNTKNAALKSMKFVLKSPLEAL